MPSTTYVDFRPPAVDAEWLNEVNDYVFDSGGLATPSGGKQDAMNVLLQSMGYSPFVPYTAGLVMGSTDQTVLYQNAVYAPNLADLPFTTSGAFEAAKFHPATLVDETGGAHIGLDDKAAGANYTTLQAYRDYLAASTGAAGVGGNDGQSGDWFTQMQQFVDANAQLHLDFFLPDSFVRDGSVAYTTEVNAALAFLAANPGWKELVMPENFTLNLDGLCSMRAANKIIRGSNTPLILTSSTAGFSLAGERTVLRGFRASQSSQTFTPTFAYIYNDATTPAGSYCRAEDCTGYSVYRGIHFYMGDNGSGNACYRHVVKDCDFSNFYLQGTWSGSFGIAFDGPFSGDAAGNDSRVINTIVKGYEKNYLINNSASTQLFACSGDGAASNISYEGNSSGLQVIGGYYEYNDDFITVVGSAKYDAYIIAPSYGNNTNFITGAGITFVSGILPVGAPVGVLRNGAFLSNGPAGTANISGTNGITLKTNNADTTRMAIDGSGDITFSNGRILVTPTNGVYSDTYAGYSGGSTPVILGAANNLRLQTQSTNRLTIDGTGLVLVPGAYASTTASAANMFVAGDGTLQRSTSAEKYKADIEPLDVDDAVAKLLQLEPIWYRSKCDGDNKAWSWHGLGAEAVSKIEPRWVQWAHPTRTVVDTPEHEIEVSPEHDFEVTPAVKASPAQFDPVSKIEIRPAVEAQPAVFVKVPATFKTVPATYRIEADTSKPMEPEGVQYERLTVPLLAAVQRHQAEIQALRDEIAALAKGEAK